MSLSSDARRPPQGLRPVRWAALDARTAQAPAPPAPQLVPAPAWPRPTGLRRSLGRVHAQARAIVATAHAEAVELRTRAAEEGRAAGLAQGQAQCLALVSAARITLRAARQERRRILAAIGPELSQLARDLAAAVVARELELSPDEVLAMARQLLARTDGPAVLRVHPDLMPLLEAESATFDRLVTVRPDATLATGGVVVAGEGGELDGSIDSRLARVGTALPSPAPGGAAHA